MKHETEYMALPRPVALILRGVFALGGMLAFALMIAGVLLAFKALVGFGG